MVGSLGKKISASRVLDLRARFAVVSSLGNRIKAWRALDLSARFTTELPRIFGDTYCPVHFIAVRKRGSVYLK